MNRLDWSPDLSWCREKIRKTFTVGQANKALVLVRLVVGDLVKEYERLNDLQEYADMCQARQAWRPSGELQDRMQDAVDKIKDCLDELNEIGVLLTDFQRGTVDFPAEHNGREIFLCWQFGQEKVGYWREPDATFAQKQSVKLLGEAEAVRAGQPRD
ncbi:MAG: DUF2203 domain-containing protein [Planctomycetes bacterium]|nr:DUF2203 domain-containing protein [Planctomycetota bacterium]